MATSVHYDVKGLDEVERFLDTLDTRIARETYDLLDDLRKRGEYYMRLYAPVAAGGLMRRITSERPLPVVWSPQMRSWEAATGVRQGERYPLYAHGGTGIYKAGIMGGTSPLPTPGAEGKITSHTAGKPLTFQKKGEPRRFKMWVRGQRAKPFALYAFQQLLPYTAGRIRRMFGRT